MGQAVDAETVAVSQVYWTMVRHNGMPGEFIKILLELEAGLVQRERVCM